MTVRASKPKHVVEIARDQPLHWVGDGFPVRSVLSYQASPEAVSPFLLLDYAAPHGFSPAARPRGVGEHPHRGFETVTVAYQGELAHRDSSGATGSLGPGDVQWMTAGSGILHEERHGRDFTRRGGTLEMVQFWVNLPSRHKMAPPAYQDIRAEQIPTVELPGAAGTARVIAGQLLGVEGPARTFSPVNVYDLRLSRSIALEVPEGHTAVLLVRDGSLRVKDLEQAHALGPAELALWSQEGNALELDVVAESKALLLTGEPLGEPVVGHGPFVMNTAQEIRRAFMDFQAGRLVQR